ncbi:hypothetical protein IscW_ISCW015687 [Ixodes scapularis]|uniref:Uncharacterized protein n=1 Tax=Ixodes scapularis TaxID=6945 RepID=B7P0W8_IXOSC|nr:hypothetical protein IscW_ISCW015687 [Ixodes scapularis]|eukprot:XP_002399483.1 hypothetical protein IscW_ISCW015687 [Ixodes scapularis]
MWADGRRAFPRARANKAADERAELDTTERAGKSTPSPQRLHPLGSGGSDLLPPVAPCVCGEGQASSKDSCLHHERLAATTRQIAAKAA